MMYTQELTECVRFSGRNGKGPFGEFAGRRVYPHKAAKEDVREGDEWVCRMTFINNGSQDPLFAIPVTLVSREQEPEEDAGGRKVEVFLTGMNGLCSKEFDGEAYNVYRSLDGQRLEIERDADGSIECRDNTLVIQDLDAFAKADGHRLLCNCTRNGDRITVDLTSRTGIRAPDGTGRIRTNSESYGKIERMVRE